jgi:hypothetical protein
MSSSTPKKLPLAAFTSLVFAVFYAPLGLIFLLLAEVAQQPKFSIEPLFSFMVLLLPSYAWSWVPALTAFLLLAFASTVFTYVRYRKKLTKPLTFKAVLVIGAGLGSLAGLTAMMLWNPSVFMALLSGALPGAVCGFLCSVILLEAHDVFKTNAAPNFEGRFA